MWLCTVTIFQDQPNVFLSVDYFVKFRDVRMTQSSMMIDLSRQSFCLESIGRLYNNLEYEPSLLWGADFGPCHGVACKIHFTE